MGSVAILQSTGLGVRDSSRRTMLNSRLRWRNERRMEAIETVEECRDRS